MSRHVASNFAEDQWYKEQHEDDLAQHVREGGELDVAADDADLQLGGQ